MGALKVKAFNFFEVQRVRNKTQFDQQIKRYIKKET